MTHRASHYIPRSLERYQRAARKLFVRALYRLWFLSGFCISLWLPPLCVLFPFLHPCLWLPTYLGMLRWHALKQSKLEATSWDQMDRELDYPMLVCLPQPPVDAVVPSILTGTAVQERFYLGSFGVGSLACHFGAWQSQLHHLHLFSR